MFESTQMESLDATAAAAAVAECHLGLVQHETQMLQLAAHWADLHAAEALGSDAGPGRERGRQLGGDGTPLVAEFAPAEFGCLEETTAGSAMNLMADALDLRHRLPRLWQRVRAGEVRSWRARKVAQATRHLTLAAAGQVDGAIAGSITALPWARFENLLVAQIIAADPAQAEAAARQADAERFVRAGRTSEHGLKLLVARAAAGDVIWFVAMVNRIAEILGIEGDPDPVDVRRSKAIGILAQPAEALRLLCAHRDDQGSGADQDPAPSDEPAGPAEGVDHRSVRISPPSVDPERCRPRATLYVHLSADALSPKGVGAPTSLARIEDIGPVLLGGLGRVLGNRCHITVKPVLDLADAVPVDAYEVPARMRELMHLRTPADAFPYGVNAGRRMDLDHTVPYVLPDRGGPPGQTRADNLSPLTRYHHRVKTHSQWRLRQPAPGIYLWRSPHHRIYLVTSGGTHPLGNSTFASDLWRAANGKTPVEARLSRVSQV